MSVEGFNSSPVTPTESPVIESTQSAEPQVEVPKIEVPKKEDDFLAPKFAALTRKEKQVRAQEAAIKAREAELNKRMLELEGKSKSQSESESQLLAQLKKNPLKFMTEHGLTFDQLTDMQLNEQNPTPQMLIEQMRAELDEKYSKELNGLKETLAQKDEREKQERYDSAVTGYKSEIDQFVQANADTYELIVNNGATDLMFETAEAFYQQTGEVPELEKVAQAVEAHLEEEANKILQLKKFQSRLQPPQKLEANTGLKSPQTAPTLSNTLSAEVPKSGTKFLSDEESKKAAAKLLNWES